MKSLAVLVLGAALVGIQLFRAPEESAAVFAIVATCWWFARMQLARNRDRHPQRAKRARQVSRAVMNSGVVSAAFWLLIALVKATNDMTAEQGEEVVSSSAWRGWAGLFLLVGLLVILVLD